VTLDDDDIEAIADRVIAKLRRPTDRLVSVRDVARALGMSPGWVYRHADELGARRLGEGRNRALRFDLEQTVQRFAAVGAAALADSTLPSAAPRRGRPPKRADVGSLELIAPRGGDRP
jgi:DNA-binding transcriptional MocR family regulator